MLSWNSPLAMPRTSLSMSSMRLLRTRSSRTFYRFIVFSISKLKWKLRVLPLSFSWDPVGAPSCFLVALSVSCLPDGPAPPVFPVRLSSIRAS